MKKFFAVLILSLFSVSVFAQTTQKAQISYDENTALVNKLGVKILQANNLPDKITFNFSDEDHVNAYANIKNEIYVYKGLIKLVETDDELAGVIGHEIGHISNKHIQKQSVLGAAASLVSSATASLLKAPVISKIADGIGVLSLLKVSRSAEYEADLTGADLMIGAGYDPKAMLSLLSKISQDYIDIIQTHPSGNKRLVNLYDYLSYNYPEKVKGEYDTESYRKFKVYMDSVLKERASNPKKLAEYNKKQAKLRQERIKRAEKIKKGSNGWDSAFNVIFSSEQ